MLSVIFTLSKILEALLTKPYVCAEVDVDIL